MSREINFSYPNEPYTIEVVYEVTDESFDAISIAGTLRTYPRKQINLLNISVLNMVTAFNLVLSFYKRCRKQAASRRLFLFLRFVLPA